MSVRPANILRHAHTAVLVLCCALAVSAAASPDSPSQGFSALSCEQFLASERNPQDKRLDHFFAWVQGVLSVFNALTPPQRHIEVSRAELEAYLMHYCAAHPKAPVLNALLYYLLEERKRGRPLQVRAQAAEDCVRRARYNDCSRPRAGGGNLSLES